MSLVVNYICEGFYRVFLLYKQTPWRRGGKSISVSGDRGDNAITKKRKQNEHFALWQILSLIFCGIVVAILKMES
jgi:hypothetical protein